MSEQSDTVVWHQLWLGAAGIATALTGFSLLAHYYLGYEMFRRSGLMLGWEIVYGWALIGGTVFVVAFVVQMLSYRTRIPPVVIDSD